MNMKILLKLNSESILQFAFSDDINSNPSNSEIASLSAPWGCSDEEIRSDVLPRNEIYIHIVCITSRRLDDRYRLT